MQHLVMGWWTTVEPWGRAGGLVGSRSTGLRQQASQRRRQLSRRDRGETSAEKNELRRVSRGSLRNHCRAQRIRFLSPPCSSPAFHCCLDFLHCRLLAETRPPSLLPSCIRPCPAGYKVVRLHLPLPSHSPPTFTIRSFKVVKTKSKRAAKLFSSAFFRRLTPLRASLSVPLVAASTATRHNPNAPSATSLPSAAQSVRNMHSKLVSKCSRPPFVLRGLVLTVSAQLSGTS
jgi:hypothetical protein